MRNLFVRGLIALLPMLVTIVALYLTISFLYTNVGVPLGDAMKWIMVKITGQTTEYLERESWFFRSGAPVVGLVLGMMLVFLVGAVVATFVGKKTLSGVEAILVRTPVISVIYPYAKQFTEFFSPGGGKAQFKNAVAVPFPAHGIYSIGFVTGEGLRHLNDVAKKPMMTVFVPTSPTPISGFVCWVPREEVVPLPISVDEALRIIISCGVLTPNHQAVRITDFAAAAAREGKPLALPPELQKVAEPTPKTG